MCPFYEYPTHNNQHAFFLKCLLCFLRSIHCNYIEWFSWFTNFGIMYQHQVCQSMVHHRDPRWTSIIAPWRAPGLPPAALKSEPRRHDAKRPLEAVATSWRRLKIAAFSGLKTLRFDKISKIWGWISPNRPMMTDLINLTIRKSCLGHENVDWVLQLDHNNLITYRFVGVFIYCRGFGGPVVQSLQPEVQLYPDSSISEA